MSGYFELLHLASCLEGAEQTCERILALPQDEVAERVIAAVRTDLVGLRARVSAEITERRERER